MQAPTELAEGTSKADMSDRGSGGDGSALEGGAKAVRILPPKGGPPSDTQHGGFDFHETPSSSVLAANLWDRVLLDAPCSGSGVLAKRADMRWRRTVQDVEETLVPLQVSEAACAHARV